MDRCLCLKYIYHDVDIVELSAWTWNGNFGGSTRLYVAQGYLDDAAALLAGFPADVQDKREIIFGAFGAGIAGGAMELKLSCSDSAGHSRLEIAIEADYPHRDARTERVELISAFEPAALDRFVDQMRLLGTSLEGSAVLTFA